MKKNKILKVYNALITFVYSVTVKEYSICSIALLI